MIEHNDIEEEMEQIIKEVCCKFNIVGEYRSFEVINSGHINSTYRVYFLRRGEIKDYILQRVNTYVFKEPISVMENIALVTEFIRAKIKEKQATAKRNVLHYCMSQDDKYYTIMEDGSFWRCCRYIDESVSFERTDDLKVIEEAGKAFGEFQLHLADFPVEKLSIVIPHFHNTERRYTAFREAIAEDSEKRVALLQEEIAGYMELEEISTKLYKLQKAKILPLRVTHNDTKIINVLFEEKTQERLSVIDLDTVMPGLVAFDFGDALRVCASTGKEDEKDLDAVAVDMAKYESFTRGFVGACKSLLTASEKDTLALGAVAMTVECGMRFLTDYINGDKYFKIHYPDQNLVRARCHLVLARDMIKKLDEMQAIVNKYCE